MTKNEILAECWIPYKIRLPPNEDIPIVVWNYESKKPETGFARVFRAQQEQLRRNPNLLKEWENRKNTWADNIAITGYKTSHWMYLPEPKK